MGSEQIDHIVGERLLAGRSSSGENIQIKIQLGVPRPYPDESGYECPFRIIGPDFDVTRWMGGLDSIQALHAALYIVPVYVRRVCDDRGIAGVHWAEAGDNLGFPIAPGG